MPLTGLMIITGAVAIAALPPLNGFTGEWLLYRGLAEVGLGPEPSSALVAIGGVAALALVGALAALCFVRLVGVVLLGSPRSEAARSAHESPPALTVPLVLLGLACLAVALLPGLVVRAQATLLGPLAGARPSDVPAVAAVLSPLRLVNLLVLGGGLLVGLLIARLVRGAAVEDTWGCGYVAPTARMQYTGRSFSELLAERLLPTWLRARLVPRRPEGVFPRSAELSSDSRDPLTRGAYEPLLARLGDRLARLRFLQHGKLHVYLVYIAAMVVLGLTWVGVRGWWSP
jgi:NADH:ubiquinone oxidoreductase subunit 5 (subunit L)/multisubunit Na+/H+ antiporter MnhA subunit